MSDIEQRVQNAVKRALGDSSYVADVAEVAQNVPLSSVGADALHCVSIAMEIEDEFHIDLSDYDLEAGESIRDIAEMVERKLAAA